MLLGLVRLCCERSLVTLRSHPFFSCVAADSLSLFGPKVGEHLVTAPGLWFWLLIIIGCCFLPYICFQLHLLPHDVGKCVGRLYFRPCLPCTIYSNKVEFKGKWWAYVDESTPPVLLGQAPLFQSQLRELDMLGVRAVVNLCDEFKGPSHAYRKRGVSLLWLKTVDHLEPTVEAMRTAVSFIEHHRKRGNGVYIHCKSGRGRSAAIAMAWLMQVRGMRPAAANQHLLNVRKVRAKLFLQKNLLQFYEELGDAPPAQGGGGGNARMQRTISYAAPKQYHPNNRGNTAKNILQGGSASPTATGDGGGGGGAGGVGGRLRNFSFRHGGAAGANRAPACSSGLERPSMAGFAGFGSQYGLAEAAPDWEKGPGATGVWEVNVSCTFACLSHALARSRTLSHAHPRLRTLSHAFARCSCPRTL